MKPKALCKILIDIALAAVLLFLMGFPFWGDAAHEWTGAGMFVLSVAHNLLNVGWWRGIGKGRYHPIRVFWLVINLLLLLAMFGLLLSGTLLSRHVFTFLPLKGGIAFARTLHMVSSYWCFVLMALHLGMHWEMLLGMARKRLRRSRWLTVAGILMAAYGVYAFFKRSLPDYLFWRTQFVFMDFEEPPLLFYIDYLAVMGLFVFLSHYGLKYLRERRETA